MDFGQSFIKKKTISYLIIELSVDLISQKLNP
jgi:hypothetical protein